MNDESSNNDTGSNNIRLEDGKNDYKRFIAHQVNRNYRRIPADWNRIIRTYISNIRRKRRIKSLRSFSIDRSKSNDDDDEINNTETETKTTLKNDDDYSLKSSLDGFVPQKGDTFLHLVCTGFPSLSAVKTLLNFYKNNNSNNDNDDDDDDDDDCVVGLQNVHGTTPFHVAIACCAPYRVIQLLHQEYYNYYDNNDGKKKKKQQQQQLCSISTKCAKLPLHLACMQHFYSGILMNDTVAKLLKLMVEDFPSALYMPDHANKYPLHLLWDHLCAPIYRHWPNFSSTQLRIYESQSSPYYYTDTTLKYNRNHVWEKLKVLLRIHNIHHPSDKQNNHNHSTITTTLIKTNSPTYNNNNNNNKNDENKKNRNSKNENNSIRYQNPFHILTQIPNCPPEFMDIAIHMIPQNECQQYLHQMDDYGRLPIHYASMDCTNLRNTQFISLKIIPQHDTNNDNVVSTSNNTNSSAPLSTKKYDTETKKTQIVSSKNGIHLSSIQGQEKNRGATTSVSFIPRTSDGYYKFYIDTILDHISWAAPKTISMRDNITHRFPLHLALASKKTWNDGIASIVAAYPEAVTSFDPITKLYPFMMAATTTTATTTYKENQNSKYDAVQNNYHETKEQKQKKQIMKDCTMLPTTKRKEDEEDSKKLLTIYKLLRTYPEVLKYNAIPQPCIGEKRRLSSPSSLAAHNIVKDYSRKQTSVKYNSIPSTETTTTKREEINDAQTLFHPIQKKRRFQ